MTLLIRDASNFDASVSFEGLAGFTHKATEGTTIVHNQCGPRLTAARDFGIPVLGAYHVLRTGNLAGQLQFWLSYLDSHVPWWRTHPHFILQIDAETWSYDDVSASTVLEFAGMLVTQVASGWKVTYASHGQYGDTLRGIATRLWNANYTGSSGGAYPGDVWFPGWASYSGQIPVFLQYTSTPFDKNAYRGDLASLLSLVTSGGPPTMMTETDRTARNADHYLYHGMALYQDSAPAVLMDVNGTIQAVPLLMVQHLKAIESKLDTLVGTEPPNPTDVAMLSAKVDKLIAALAAAGHAVE